MTVTCGIDRAEDHHDVALVDETGKLVAKRRIAGDADGYRQLIELLAETGGRDGLCGSRADHRGQRQEPRRETPSRCPVQLDRRDRPPAASDVPFSRTGAIAGLPSRLSRSTGQARIALVRAGARLERSVLLEREVAAA